MDRKVLITECKDNKGLVAKVTNVCFQSGLNIIKNSEYVDNINGEFFMRTELEGDFSGIDLLKDLALALPENSRHRLVNKGKKKLLVLVTKEAHCLGELLIKSHYGALDAEIVAVVGNHPDLEELAQKFQLPFHFITHQDLNRQQHEQEILECLAGYAFDYIVLAKYMRVLSESFIAQYSNKIINIHHSFLPAFIGAKPYHQAYERGVKIIGATAHFVTNDLDDGPIITQDVVSVDHSHSPEDMAKSGREVEESVLTGALRKVIEEKVIVYGNRTVVFD
ncbi:MAG: formyltetrahydrofolate deformylase [Gammaproteobacteria bacterium]|nr:MAG: formyltetrahydrofolate deformylase [Gammaproteobacteria bacterium]